MTVSDPIEVCVPSEYHPLQAVVMCLANPWSSADRRVDLPLLRQALRNDFDSYDHVRVRQQQHGLAEILRGHGVEVVWASPLGGIVSQHYTRDPAFAIDATLYVARPRRAARQAEIPGLRDVLARMSRVVWLDDGTIEGGDVIVDVDHVMIGLGEETDPAGVDALRYRLRESGRRVVVLDFAMRGVIHTDTVFNVVAPGLAIVHRPAFLPDTWRWIDDHYDVIEVDEQQRRALSVNTLSINTSTVVIRDDDRLAEQLRDRGMTVITHDYTAVTRLPGSYRCTTMPVRRTPEGSGP
jgi:N-dimethylarginine dimethylaminohydrolase